MDESGFKKLKAALPQSNNGKTRAPQWKRWPCSRRPVKDWFNTMLPPKGRPDRISFLILGNKREGPSSIGRANILTRCPWCRVGWSVVHPGFGFDWFSSLCPVSCREALFSCRCGNERALPLVAKTHISPDLVACPKSVVFLVLCGFFTWGFQGN